MNFTAIDFETANGHQTSACSIGIASVQDNRIVDLQHRLIRPEPYYFSKFNIAVHGITSDDVGDAPSFGELWPDILPYLSGNIVAAHFAPFDISVLRSTLDHYGIRHPDMDILCSCSLSRAAYPGLPSHSLDTVCSHLDIPLVHHQADSDAAGSAGIILKIADEYNITDLEGIKGALNILPGFIRDGAYKPCRARSYGPKTDTFSAECPSEGFMDKDFVFSGTLQGMPRKKAMEVVVKGGGVPQKTVTQSTDYLVVGAQDMRKLHGKTMSSKMRRAMELQQQGHPVRIISEDDFRDMIPDDLYNNCFTDDE